MADRRDVYRRLILAIDGGQTATIAVVGTLDGTLLGAGRGGPVVRIRDSRDRRTTMAHALCEAISGACRSAQLSEGTSVDLAYLSLTGGADIAAEVVRSIIGCTEVVAETDALAALAAGTGGGPGIGLIAGTGCVAVAVQESGETLVRGGWGFLLGDEGSGFWIGLQSLKAAIAMSEGAVGPDPLLPRVLAHFAADDMRQVAARVYAELDRAAVAALARPTIAEADAGEPTAMKIADEAGRHLAALATRAARAAATSGGPSARVVPGGGVLQPGNAVWKAFADQLTRDLPDHRLVAPAHPPVIGAYWLALRRRAVPAADPHVAARIQGSLPPLSAALTKSHPTPVPPR